MAAEKRKVKKWGWKTLLALLGLAAAGAFGFFSIFNTVRVAAAEPALSENEANEAASVTITDAELEQLLSGELTLDSLTRTGTDEAPAASEAQGTAAGEQPARTESEAAASSEPEDSASGTEQSAASSSEAPAEKKQQEAACDQAFIQFFDFRACLGQAFQKDLHTCGQTLVSGRIGHRLCILPDVQRTQLGDRIQIDFLKQGGVNPTRSRTFQHHAFTTGNIILYRHEHSLINPLKQHDG